MSNELILNFGFGSVATAIIFLLVICGYFIVKACMYLYTNYQFYFLIGTICLLAFLLLTVFITLLCVYYD